MYFINYYMRVYGVFFIIIMMLIYTITSQIKLHIYQNSLITDDSKDFVSETVRIDTKNIVTDSELIIEDRDEDTDIFSLESEVTTDEFKSPDSVPGSLVDQEKTQYYTIKSGDTLDSILRKSGMEKSDIMHLASKLKPHFNPKRLRIGQEISVYYSSEAISKVRINLSSAKHIMIAFMDGNIEVQNVESKLIPYIAKKRIVVYSDTNFMDQAREEGVPESIISSLITALSYQVNFKKDIIPGSSFEILYEKVYTDDGMLVGSSNVIYANAQIKNKVFDIYRYDGSTGGNFYYKNGNSVAKSLLKAPITRARISGTYGMRQHPTLKYRRLHKGVDYAAVSGTPIHAAGDGVIESMGYSRSFGNVIRVKHNDKFTTIYAHAKRFAKGMHRHRKVKQGEVIAYVGSTGVSTGPHLHYEVRENGKAVNPLRISQPMENTLKGVELKKFSSHIDNIHKMLPSVTYDQEIPRNQLL